VLSVQQIWMAAAGSSEKSYEGSVRFRPMFLQRLCRSVVTVHDKQGFSFRLPVVAGA